MECPTGCPNKVYAVMQDCWQWEPSLRPSFGEIRERLESLFNDTNLNEEVERELGSENSNPADQSFDMDEAQCDLTSNGSSFKAFKSGPNGMPPYHNKQSPGSSPNLNDLKESGSLGWNSPSSGLISTKSTVVPLKRTSNKSSGKSSYVQQHKLVNKLKQAPVPPKRTSSFRDSSFQPDLESIRNSINMSNAASRANNSNLSAASKQQLQQPEDEEILEGARETMNGLEKVFESLSGSVQSSSDNLMGSNLNEIKSSSIEDLKNVLNKQKLPGQKLKPSKKGLKLSKSSHKNSLSSSKKADQSNEIEKPNVFSNLSENRNKVQVANLVEPENVKKAINRYGTLPKGASIGYLDSLQTCEINTNELADYPENADLSASDYPSLMQASDSLLTSPDFVPVDYNRSMKQPINSNNHLATVSRKLSKNKTKKISKSIDDNGLGQQSSPFQLSSPDQRLNNFKPGAFNLTRQKSDLTHIRTNYDKNSFDSINDLDNDLNARRTSFLTGSSFFSKSKSSSSKKKSNDLPSTSSASSASSSNSNTINRDFSQSKNNDDTASISSFKPYLSAGQQQANLPSPPAPFNNVRKNLKSPPKQLAAKPFKCSTAFDCEKSSSVFRKPEVPSKFRSQSRNEEEEGFYVRSDQLDQLHAQLNSQLSLNSNDPNTDLEDNSSFGNTHSLNQPAADVDVQQTVNSNKSFFESFRLKSRKKSADSQDSPQLPPRNNSGQVEEKKKSSVKLPFVGNRKVNKAGPQVPAPKIPLLPRQSVFNSSNNQNNLMISNSSMAEYVTPVLKKTDRSRSNDSSDESSNSENNVISKPSEFKKDRSLFGLDKKGKTGGQIRAREKSDAKMSRDDEKRQSTCSITSLKQKWKQQQPASKNSPESSKSQRSLLNDLNLVNTRDSPLLNEFTNKSRAFINGKLRKDKNELDNDDLSEQLGQYKRIITQLSNVIERIFDEISINDHDQLKDLLTKIDQLRTNFQNFSDLGFIALHQRFKYNEFLKKFESQAGELNQYYDNNVNIKLVTWNKLCLALKLSLKELVSIVENQK